MSKVIVIGGGAAGAVAAIFAARNGHRVELFEKNEKIGKKLFITGKGRCNVTNAGDMDALFDAVKSNPKFLYSAFYSFTNEQAMDFFEELGVRLKVERGNRVFPKSDHSSDIIHALKHELEQLGVEIHFCTEVKDVLVEHEKFTGIVLKNGKKVSGDACVVATGGISYASTGSTGDGYRFAEKTGHKVTELYPSLVPMEVKEWYAKELQGLSLRNVRGTILDGKKKLYDEFGEMLFTHFGVSGPVILSASSFCAKAVSKGALKLVIDLKPALSGEQLDERILRDFAEAKNRQFKNSLSHLYPAKLIPEIIRRSGIDPDKQVNEITRQERRRLVEATKGLTFTLTGLRPFKEAIITQGGISVKETDPSTMESKRVKGLYFAGELLDLDAVTGGFNLQIAWSTGWQAGKAAAKDTTL